MNGRTVHITQKSGVDGRLFGSVTNHDIAESLKRIGFDVTKAQVREIAEKKMKDLNCDSVESAMKMVEGSARSMGLEVAG